MMNTKTFSKILVGSDEEGNRAKVSGLSSNEGRAESGAELSASLYDDTISDKTAATNWKAPLGVALVVIVGGAFLVGYFGGSSGDGSAKAVQPGLRDPSQLEQLVEQAKHQGEEPSETGPGKDRQAASSPQVSQEPARNPEKEPPSSRVASVTKEPLASAVPRQAPPRREQVERVDGSAEPVTGPVQSERTESLDSVGTADKSESVEESGEQVQVPGEEAAGENESEFTEEEIALYNRLLENSPVAGKLASGGYSTLEFRSWRIVQRARREVWYDLISNWSNGGPEVHFIWAIDRETGAIRPLSQAARNLEATSGSR